MTEENQGPAELSREEMAETMKPTEAPEKPEGDAVEPVAPETEDLEKANSEGEESEETEKVKEIEQAEEPGEGKPEEEETLIKDDDPKGVQKRINRAVKKEKLATKEATYQRERAEAAEAKLKTPVEAPKEEKVPVLEDYEDYEAFNKATIDFQVKKAVAEMTPKEPEAPEQEEAPDYRLTGMKEEGEDNHEDFNEVVANEKFPLSPIMLEAAIEGDMGSEVLYQLGKNLPEANRIAGLSPTAQVKEMGKFEARLEAQAKNTKKPTEAPPPIVPSKGSGKAPSKSLEKMSTDEFMETRNAKTGHR